MPDENALSDEDFVRTVVEEVGARPLSALNQIIYLLERSGATRPRFRFTFQPFLGVRDPQVDGLVQSAKLSLMLGRNGIPASEADDERERVREFVARLPEDEHDLRLLAVVDFVRWQGWHDRAKLPLAEMVESARPQFAAEARLGAAEAVDLLVELGVEADERAGTAAITS